MSRSADDHHAHQTLPYQPDFEALLTNLATHREQAEYLLGNTGPMSHQATLIQAAIAHAMTGLLLVAEEMTAERAADADPAAEVPATTATEPVVQDAPPPRTTARMRVFHNNHPRDAFPGGYVPGQSVTEVYACDENDVGPDVDDLDLADRVFRRSTSVTTRPSVSPTRGRCSSANGATGHCRSATSSASMTASTPATRSAAAR